MNAIQTRRLQHITSRHADYVKHDGAMSFTVEEVSDGELLFSATNVLGDLRWFERARSFHCVIGPRGGVRQYANLKDDADIPRSVIGF